jgi:hypothetical protein
MLILESSSIKLLWVGGISTSSISFKLMIMIKCIESLNNQCPQDQFKTQIVITKEGQYTIIWDMCYVRESGIWLVTFIIICLLLQITMAS